MKVLFILIGILALAQSTAPLEDGVIGTLRYVHTVTLAIRTHDTLQYRSTCGCKPSQLPLIPDGRTSAQSADGGKEKVFDDASEKENSKIKQKKKELLEITTVGVPTSFNIPDGTNLLTFTVRGGGGSGGGFDVPAVQYTLDGGIAGTFAVSKAGSLGTGFKEKDLVTVVVGGQGTETAAGVNGGG